MFIRKKHREPYDINSFNNSGKFEEAIRDANQHRAIAGVNEIISVIEKKYQAYSKEINVFISQEKPIIDAKYSKWFAANRNMSISICIFIISLLYSLIFSQVRIPILSSLLETLALFGFEGGFLTAIIFKVIAIVCDRQYTSYYRKKVSPRANAFNTKYMNDLRALCEKIDTLYLNSLEPTLRETILMRRDQERHHRELMESQYHHQRVMEEGQRRIQEAQEELLQIEREREQERKSRY